MGAEISSPKTQDKQLRFLFIEDNLLDVELLERELRRGGFEFTFSVVQTPEAFTRELHAHPPHVVLADYNLPEWNGMEGLEILGREKFDIPFILVTGALGDVTAVDCIKQGATDYVLKDALATAGCYAKSLAGKASARRAQAGGRRAGAFQPGSSAICVRGLA